MGATAIPKEQQEELNGEFPDELSVGSNADDDHAVDVEGRRYDAEQLQSQEELQ